MTTKTLYFKGLPHRQAFHMAWPMIISNISAPLMGIADTAMLGHLESALYLGAVAIGANIMAFLLWMFAFLRMGTTSFVGRAWGAGENQHLLLQFGQSLLFAVSAGLVLIALQWLLIPIAINLMAPDPEIAQLAARYCHIRLTAAPAAFVTFVVLGLLIGLQNTRLPLFITVLANALNILLDYLFIVRFGWNSDGAAFATLIAEFTGCAIALWVANKALKQALGNTYSLPALRELLNLKGWSALLKLNGDLFIRTALLLFIFNFFTAQGAQLSHTVLAANAILMQLVLLQSFGLDGYAHAAEAMGAKALGGRKQDEFMRACAASIVAGLGLALVISLCFAAGKTTIIAMFTSIHDVADATSTYYAWLIAFPLVSIWTYMLDGIFIGAGRTRTLLGTMVLSVFIIFFPLWWATQSLGNHGLWLSFIIFNASRGASLAWSFYTLSVKRLWF
ncbi:multidrug resistance protein, MATE family [Alteromonadaceae bacterium Bs31]|nr:multidrug resistance protein, MATE family [Alteromonadaceae bacterium Bs31]